jgi:hypothetical protein
MGKTMKEASPPADAPMKKSFEAESVALTVSVSSFLAFKIAVGNW